MGEQVKTLGDLPEAVRAEARVSVRFASGARIAEATVVRVWADRGAPSGVEVVSPSGVVSYVPLPGGVELIELLPGGVLASSLDS